MAALSVMHGIVNSLPTNWLNHFAKTYAVFHIAVLFAAMITLLVMQKDKHTASYTFTNVPAEPASGWSPPGFSFLFGFLSVAWTMVSHLNLLLKIGIVLTCPRRTTTPVPTSQRRSRILHVPFPGLLRLRWASRTWSAGCSPSCSSSAWAIQPRFSNRPLISPSRRSSTTSWAKLRPSSSLSARSSS